MSKNTISQTQARRLRARVDYLEGVLREQRSAYTRKFPGGVNIAQASYGSATDFLPAVIDNSRKLGHAVVCVTDGNTVLYYALPHKDTSA